MGDSETDQARTGRELGACTLLGVVTEHDKQHAGANRRRPGGEGDDAADPQPTGPSFELVDARLLAAAEVAVEVDSQGLVSQAPRLSA